MNSPRKQYICPICDTRYESGDPHTLNDCLAAMNRTLDKTEQMLEEIKGQFARVMEIRAERRGAIRR